MKHELKCAGWRRDDRIARVRRVLASDLHWRCIVCNAPSQSKSYSKCAGNGAQRRRSSGQWRFARQRQSSVALVGCGELRRVESRLAPRLGAVRLRRWQRRWSRRSTSSALKGTATAHTCNACGNDVLASLKKILFSNKNRIFTRNFQYFFKKI